MPDRFIYLFYRVFLALSTPVVLFYALVRVLRNRAYARTLRERLGFLPRHFRQEHPGAIWIHAVSVGEVMAARALMLRLRESLGAPMFVSVSTLAGHRLACEQMEDLAIGCFYAPIDYARVIRRVLRILEPTMVVVLETEIWPNLFRESKRAGCGLVIANGRISAKAFPAYKRQRWFFQHVLPHADAILVQSETMRLRFTLAGAPAERIEITGNLKYDFATTSAEATSPVIAWLRQGSGPVLIAASTTADAETDEDGVVLDVFEKLKGWRLILAPRKPERFAPVAQMIGTRRIAFWKRSDGHGAKEHAVLLLDTIGELAPLFAEADVVFMGGTLTSTEGHNFLEPALAGKPVVAGPRLANFEDIAADFRSHRALIEIGNAGELESAIRRAETDRETGALARSRAEAQRGAAEKTVRRVEEIYSLSIFRRLRRLPMRMLLRPAAQLWMRGSRWRAAREWGKRKQLETPVISVGNVTVGGTGKTPFVLHLAKRFRERGLEPVVLTRGYGRASHHECLVLARGDHAAVWHTGDEPQIVLRSGKAGLAIGADRYAAGKEAERILKPDVFIADDGFSHLRLARDVDIVLIDSLDPFGDFEAIPLGRLREPLDALARADIFVITRCETWRPFAAIENKLRECNERAPIFRSRLLMKDWVVAGSAETAKPPERTIAFCGLGNANSFWRSIEQLGVKPLDRLSYGDHHQYAPRELTQLVNYARTLGVQSLLTTEKDLVNLPKEFPAILGDIGLLWLRVDVEIDNEAGLLDLINPESIRAKRASDRQPARARR